MPYHINAKGDAGLCKAVKGNCPFGDADEHFTTPEAARAAFEKASEAARAVPENWNAKDIADSLRYNPKLRGTDLASVRENLRRDYEDALTYKALEAKDLIPHYGDYSPGYDATDFTVYPITGGKQLSISATQNSYNDDEPLTNHTNYVQDHDEDESTSWDETKYHTYTVDVRPQDQAQVDAHETRERLKDLYANLDRPEYPEWMALPPKSPTSLSSGYRELSATAKATEAVKKLEQKIAGANKAGSSIQGYTKKLDTLAAEKLEVVNTLSAVTSPRVTKALKHEVALIDDETARTSKLKANATNRAKPANLVNLQNQLTKAKEAVENSKVTLRKAMEKEAFDRLVSHHPSTDRRRSNAQAKAWLKAHPELVDVVMKEELDKRSY
jgi:hypothetical protein